MMLEKYFNICLTEMVIRKVIEFSLFNCMSKRLCSMMEDTIEEMNTKKYKSEPFSYVMSFILFGKMRTKTRTIWRNGVGLEFISLNRKLMYSTLTNFQRNGFDHFIVDDEVESLN